MWTKRLSALLVSLVVPYFIFLFVISLNESDVSQELLEEKVLNFDVEKKKQINKPKPKKKKTERRRRSAQKLPSIRPSNVGDSLAGDGLSFGIPQFDEAEFAEFKDGGLLDSAVNEALDDASVDTPPVIKKRSPIVYPELARRQGISGYVTMNVLINEQGDVDDVEIIDSKPKEIFDLKADSTIRRWKFEPATYSGRKVKVWATQKIVFKLQ
jgi:protein TonB